MLHQTRLGDVVGNQLGAVPGGAGLRRRGGRGGMSARVYLDWNATAPLRPEARAAMLAAMDAVGNPSLGACRGAGGAGDRRAGAGAGRGPRRLRRPGEVVFTSRRDRGGGARRWPGRDVSCGDAVEHDCVGARWIDGSGCRCDAWPGGSPVADPAAHRAAGGEFGDRGAAGPARAAGCFVDAAQAVGQAAVRLRLERGGRRRSCRRTSSAGRRASARCCCAPGVEIAPLLRGRRAGAGPARRDRERGRASPASAPRPQAAARGSGGRASGSGWRKLEIF